MEILQYKKWLLYNVINAHFQCLEYLVWILLVTFYFWYIAFEKKIAVGQVFLSDARGRSDSAMKLTSVLQNVSISGLSHQAIIRFMTRIYFIKMLSHMQNNLHRKVFVYFKHQIAKSEYSFHMNLCFILVVNKISVYIICQIINSNTDMQIRYLGSLLPSALHQSVFKLGSHFLVSCHLLKQISHLYRIAAYFCSTINWMPGQIPYDLIGNICIFLWFYLSALLQINVNVKAH